MDNTSVLLSKAADILELNGWCKYTLTNEKGEHCVLGALQQASGSFSVPVFPEALQALYLHILPELSEPYDGHVKMWIEVWNDTTGRTGKEVINALRETAAKVNK